MCHTTLLNGFCENPPLSRWNQGLNVGFRERSGERGRDPKDREEIERERVVWKNLESLYIV